MQRLQHQAVTAQRHDCLGLSGRHAAIAANQPLQRRLRLGAVAGDKGDALEFAGFEMNCFERGRFGWADLVQWNDNERRAR
jgi:hypothetical protein